MEARRDLQHRPRLIRPRPRGRLSIAAISALCLVVGAGTARAQRSQAEALFDDGNRLMAEGKLSQACDAFDASNRLEPGAGILIRLGECREQNGQLASAWSAFQQALARVKDPRKRAFATARAAALEAKVSYLTVSVAPEVNVDGLVIARAGTPIEPAQWNRPLPVDGGSHLIT